MSHGSRESQLSSTTVSKMDWGGGPSYGVDGGASSSGGGRDYSLLSPAMPRKGSVVTFDVGEPGVRRHSSPAQPIRRKNAVVSTMASIADCQPLSSALKQCKDPPPSQQPAIRYVDDYRTLTQLRKRSAGDQSIISIAIDEDDSGEEEEGREEESVQADDDEDDDEEDEDCSHERTSLRMNQPEKKDHPQRHHQQHQQCEATAEELEHLKKRRASLKRNNTDDSEVEQRMARIFHEINYSVTDSVDDLAKFTTSHSSADAPAPPADSDHNDDGGAVTRVEVETQTMGDDEQVHSRKHFNLLTLFLTLVILCF